MTDPTAHAIAVGRAPRRWTTARAFCVAAVISAIASFVGVFDHSLWTPDEPRDAEVGREMLASRDFVVPTLAGNHFLEKPPLAWWVMSGIYGAFGKHDGVARLASALAGLLTLLLVFDAVRRITDPFAGVLATLVTASLSGFVYEFHRAIVDPWLALFVMLGYWGYIAAMFPPKEEISNLKSEISNLKSEISDARPVPGAPCPWAIFVIYLAAGLSFLVKGPVGPGLIAGPILIFIIALKQRSFFQSWVHVPGLIAFAGLCALWPWLLYRRGGYGLLNQFLLNSVRDRFFPPAGAHVMTGHKEPFWYYFANFPASIAPWLIAIPAMCHWFWRKRVPQIWNRPALVFLAWVFPIGLVMLSVAGTKRGLYLLPLVAPFGAAAGVWLASVVKDEKPHRIDRATVVILLAFMTLIAFAALVVPMFVEAAPHWFTREGKDYVHRIPWESKVLLSCAGGLFLLFSYFGLMLVRRGRARVAALVAWMAFGLIVTSTPIVYNAVDRFKNLHPLAVWLEENQAWSPELIDYVSGEKPDETTLGIVAYDTGRYLKMVKTEKNLEQYVAEHPDVRILMLKQDAVALQGELGRRLKSLGQQLAFDEHRTYCLFSLAAPPVTDVAPPGDAGRGATEK